MKRILQWQSPAGKFIILLFLLKVSAMLAGSEVTGWRGDGTGLYPEAVPVIEWSTEKNVIWKTPTPGWSNATPVITGGRLIILAEPSTVILLDRNTGAVTWQTPNTSRDIIANEAEAAVFKEGEAKARAAMHAVQMELQPVRKKLGEVNRKLHKNRNNEALNKEKKELEDQIKTIEARLKPHERYFMPAAQKANGYTSATPVTDGRRIYAVFGTGITVCLDMTGKRIWSRFLEHPPHRYGSCMSPLLVNGVLAVHYEHMFGLDPATGDMKWKTNSNWGWGTAVAENIGSEPLIFTCKGDVIRPDTGDIIVSGLHSLEYGGPVAGDGKIYYIQNNAVAYELPQAITANLDLKTAWQSRIRPDRYYGSPLCHNGLIYAITQNGELSVLDAKTGELMYKQAVLFPEKATVYPSITLGGRHIFISNEKGFTVVIEPGREFRQVAVNELEPFRSTPVFEGSRMYIRTLKHLYCIGK